MARRARLASAAAGPLLLALVAACASAPRAALPDPYAWPGTRAADGLLSRPELQAIVEAQARRETPPLVGWLSHQDADVRARAAFALGSVQDSAAVPALLAAVRDPDARVRADAAFALGQTPRAASAGPLLAALLRESDPAVVERLLDALARTADAQALPALAALEVPRSLRAALAMALARAGMRGVHAPAATERLLELLGDDDPAVRAAAAYAFARPTDPGFWRASADRLRAALDARGPADPALPYLATALARLAEPGDSARLAAVAQEALDWRARVNGVRALAALPTGMGEAVLLAGLRDPSHHVRRAAAEALAGADSLSADAAARVAGWIGPRRDGAAASALPALLRAGNEDAVLAWLAALPPDARTLRFAGLRALGEGRGEASFRALEAALLDPDPSASAAATAALVERWRRERSPERAGVYYPRLRAALRRGDRAGAAAAAGALADTLFAPLGARELLASAASEPEPPAVRRAVDWGALARLGRHPLLVLETERGTITLRLDAEQAPITVQAITELARAGRYDGVPFHRVVPNFVVQGGDVERGDGSGGPGFAIPSELTRLPYRRGTLAMARSDKDTEGSQLFIAHSMQPHLDGGYTAFGAVVEGMDVVDRIALGDRVLRARVLPDGGAVAGAR